LGLNRYKTGAIPVQQTDPERQEDQKSFIEQYLEPRLEDMGAGRGEVFFVDAAHFVWAAFLGHLWSWTRLFVSAPSGRKRFNVLGAINARTHQLITVTNHTYINAGSVCELLLEIAGNRFQVPVTLILDNAKYQHAQVVKDLAAKLNIELLFLPAYSPNLNLIERLWKFVKKKCLYSEYYESFDLFTKAIQGCLSKVGTDEYKSQLETLLTLKFQTFNKVQFVEH
jgi:transposase